MKLVILTVLCWLRIPVLYSIDMLDCALGRVEDRLCPEDGGWSQWSAWGQCEGECGGVGRQLRTRNCSNPPPQRNGADCDGHPLEVKPCSVPGCSYEQYDKMLAQDAVRQQELVNLKKYSGSQSALLTKCLSSNCDWSDVSQALPSEQTKFWNSLVCVKKNTGCPATGGWGDWSPWTRCNARCGSGRQTRCRVCCDPPPSSPSVTCQGDFCEYQSCTGVECGRPLSKGGEWSQWSDWSACSSPCDSGYTRRTRVCKDQSQISSEQRSPLSDPNDYDAKDYANADEYIYAYYDDDDDGERNVDNYKDDSYDGFDDVQPSYKRAKRSAKCDKVEYYNNDEEEDLRSTLKPKRTTKRTGRNTVGQMEIRLKTQTEAVSTTPHSLGLNSGQSKIKTPSIKRVEHFSEVVTQNNKLEEPSNEIIVKSITEQQISKSADFLSTENLRNTKLHKPSNEFRAKTTTRQPIFNNAEVISTENIRNNKLDEPSNEIRVKSTTKQQISKSDEFLSTENLRNNKLDKPSNEFRVKTTTKQTISKSSEFISIENLSSSNANHRVSQTPEKAKVNNDQIKKTLPKPRKKGHKITDPLPCNELYENSSTAAPCNKGQPNCVCIKGSWVSDKKYDNTKCSSSAVPYSAKIPKTEKSDDTRLNLGQSEGQSSKVHFATSSWKSMKSDEIETTTNLCITINKAPTLPETNNIDLKQSPVSTSSRKQSNSAEIANKFPMSMETQSLSHQSSFSTSTVSINNQSVYSTSSLARTAPTENLLGTITGKTSTVNVTYGTKQELPTIKTTSLYPETVDVTEGPQVVELNIFNVRPISCDLSKKLELPSFSDSFQAEGCSGPFEELKPCNTQPCNEDGGWSDWSSWSACAPDCGLGSQASMRSCTNPEPRRSSRQCQGEATRRRTCYLQPCPVTLRSSKAVFMTGDSVVQYQAARQHSSVLLLYVRLRHFSPTGSVVTRRPHDCSHDKHCDHVTLSLYRSHVLVSVLQQKCRADFLTSQRLSVGDWHEVLLTVVGAAVTLRLDDSVLVQTFDLSCCPSSPNYDTDMRVGGSRFVGEVDRLIANFKNYVFQKKREKREAWTLSDDTVAPTDSSQVQYDVNSRDIPSVSLSHFLQAPCFSNHSSWNIDLAIKPNFPDGLVLFMKGYDSRDFLFVSLEQTRIRLRVRVAAQAGECEHSEPVAPLTWTHVALSRTAEGGGVGLSVNGGHHCVVSLALAATEEPAVYCTGGILLGEMPLGIKTVLSAEVGHAEPLHSPLGLLGHLGVDNHTLDLSRLPRKIAPDLVATHPDHQYRLSSHTAASTVYYEEMLVLQGERLSMPCIYDLSPENSSEPSSIRDLDNNWYKLDIPINTLFSNNSGVHYETLTTGKAVSLNITSYPTPETVEGFYSCWLHYPLPLQSGLNIVTYGVVIISTTQDKRTWLFWIMTAHLCLVIILLVILVLLLVYEAYQDYKGGSGYYRCKKLKGNEAYKAVQLFILSDKAINRLGGLEAAEKAFERYTEYLEQEVLAETQQQTATDTDITTGNETYQSPSDKEDKAGNRRSSDREIFHSLPNTDIFNSTKMGQTVTVGMAGVEFKSPFVGGKSYLFPSESRITIDELLQSDGEADGETDATNSNDNLIDVSRRWTHKEVTGLASRETTATGIGQIQNTSAYRSIENELKFKPEKFKNLGKYVYSKQNINDT